LVDVPDLRCHCSPTELAHPLAHSAAGRCFFEFRQSNLRGHGRLYGVQGVAGSNPVVPTNLPLSNFPLNQGLGPPSQGPNLRNRLNLRASETV